MRPSDIVPLSSPEAMQVPQRRLMDPQHAAASLGVAVSTLARWRVDGTGPRWFKLGSRVRYDRSDLYGWVDAQGRRSTSDTGPEPDRAA